MEKQYNELLPKLKGKAPISLDTQDRKVWVSTAHEYQAKRGYEKLLNSNLKGDIFPLWKAIWSSESPPKIRFFF